MMVITTNSSTNVNATRPERRRRERLRVLTAGNSTNVKPRFDNRRAVMALTPTMLKLIGVVNRRLAGVADLPE
jgi:hypothetical protein